MGDEAGASVNDTAPARKDARSAALRTSALDYELPSELIATAPAEPRGSSRLLVVPRDAQSAPTDAAFADLPRLLRAGDLLVLNTSAVIPARFVGRRVDTRGRVEGLYLETLRPTDIARAHPGSPADREDGPCWVALIKAKRVRIGMRIEIARTAESRAETVPSKDPAASEPAALQNLELQVISAAGENTPHGGAWLLRPLGKHAGLRAEALLEDFGLTPLPPYILGARKRMTEDPADGADRADRADGVIGVDADSEHQRATNTPSRGVENELGVDAADRLRYQTTFADATSPGSVAAPTAGLHFTTALLDALSALGAERANVTLHVGAGTFLPVETETLQTHPMHAEWCTIPAAAARAIIAARREGRRIIAVGTTAARTLETFTTADLQRAAERNENLSTSTRILIAPGHRFAHLDGLITNFHLPRSTLLALVAALFPGGAEHAEDAVARVLAIYRHAIAARYRFYSFGDAMLILPAG
ncbi:hypothetical protein BH11PLA1_BH11PLA1_05940 [soil metagenome]